MSEGQTRLIQVEDTSLWSGVPETAQPELNDRDRWLLVTQQLAAEQEYRRQLEQDILGWEAACSALRAMLEKAKAQVEAMADANAEIGAEYIHARRCANTWKEAAREWRRAALDWRAPPTNGVPVVGVLTGHMMADDWDAIKAAAGVGEGE